MSLYSTSLYFIIPHRRFNVNIFFAKLLCPVLTAAEGYIMGVGVKKFTAATLFVYCLFIEIK